MVAFAALLLSSGALGDRIGVARGYSAGMVVFTVASVACGLAPSLPVLLGARVLQGVGAALLLPNSLALVRLAYHDPGARAKAIATWAAIGGVALAAGPVVGGILTDDRRLAGDLLPQRPGRDRRRARDLPRARARRASARRSTSPGRRRRSSPSARSPSP